MPLFKLEVYALVNYDCNQGLIIRAKDEQGARLLAENNKAAESSGTWINPTLSSCLHLSRFGEDEILLKDYRGN